MPVDTEPLTDDETAAVLHGWAHLLREQHEREGGADDSKAWYERIPIKGMAPHGAFRLPHHAVKALGGGDPHVAGAVLAHLLHVDPDNPLTVDHNTVRDIGNGDLNAGHRVLRKFVAMLRSRNTRITQPDGNHATARPR